MQYSCKKYKSFYKCRYPESFCILLMVDCSWGDPEYTKPGPSGLTNELQKGVVTSCTVDRKCNDDKSFTCAKIGTTSYCCPVPEYVCSPRGGLDYTYHAEPTNYQLPTEPYDEGTSGGRSRTFARQVDFQRKALQADGQRVAKHKNFFSCIKFLYKNPSIPERYCF